MNKLYRSLTSGIILTALFITCAEQPRNDNKDSSVAQKIEVETTQFPNQEWNITDFGAVGDGITINTEAINNAIEACHEAGGGKVIIPRGIWLTGPIEFMDNVNLHTKEGATVLFSDQYADYPYIKDTTNGATSFYVKSPLYGKDLENIAITGHGVFDGSGQAWRPVKKFKLTAREWNKLVSSGGVLNEDGSIWWPNQYALEAQGKEDYILSEAITDEEREKYKAYFRPNMLKFINCNKILLDGPTFQNSPGWCIHPLLSNNITIRNIMVRNPWNAQNGDGLDLESCQYVNVYDCTFDVGDDAICLKSGKNEAGRKRGVATAHVSVDNCIVYHGHGGFVVGSEMSGGVNNIWVTNCTFMGTDVGLRFKSTRGRGGVVEDIHIENINMVEIKGNAFTFNLFYGGKAPDEADYLNESTDFGPVPEVSVETPQFRNIYFKNVFCNGAERAFHLQGLPEMPVKNLQFENVILKAKEGFTSIYADSLQFNNLQIYSYDKTAMTLINSSNIEIQNFKTHDTDTWMAVYGNSANIDFPGVDKEKLMKNLTLGKGVEEQVIK